MMEDGLKGDDSSKMGATSSPNAARLASLQERRKALEETINKRNTELKQLCIQEAELTGIMPPEIPLEPGESPPSFRRKVYTLYQLPQKLIDNLNKEEESITELELALQVEVNLAEARLGLASDSNSTKTVHRQHMQQYQKHKQNISALKDKLDYLKQRNQIASQMSSPTQQQKQKKKARPVEQEDSVSMNINMSEPFAKSQFRHSMRSLQNPIFSNNASDQRYSNNSVPYRSKSTQLSESHSFVRQEDLLTTGIYGLSLNGYKNYVESNGEVTARQDSCSTDGQYIVSQSSPNLYQHQVYSPNFAHQQRSVSPYYSPHSPHGQHTYDNYKYKTSPHPVQKQPSPNINLKAQQYYPSHTISYQPGYRPYSTVDPSYSRTINPHQIQPHQQYEHDVMTSGLGGFWKRAENGEMSWVSNVGSDTWQRNKRFGSLDRRKNKRVHKRTSPNVDAKSATIASSHVYNETHKVPAKIPSNVPNTIQDNRQLVRTQSLGSVGVQTVDNVWPSDDNSSCESDAQSFNDTTLSSKKHKQKEWYETSLDGPAVPPQQPPKPYPPQSIAPEEKYTDFPPVQQPLATPPPQTPKPVLEIPAESNPSPRVQETNLELFNNNIPKNCTIVQQGQWKPYHEETKPFEMSDFYKYSTKYKKSPSKSESAPGEMRQRAQSIGYWQLPSNQQQRQNSESYDEDNASVICKGVYQPLQPMKCQPFSPNNSNNQSIRSVGSPLNTSLDLQLSLNVAENFSAEMNAWYQDHEQQTGNNNGNPPPMGKQRSTATLV